MKTPARFNRRQFVWRAATWGAAAVACPLVVPRSVLGSPGRPGPLERVNLAFIGCGRQTDQYNIPQYLATPGVQPVAVCDVDSWRLGQAVERIRALYESGKVSGSLGTLDTYVDYRELLARDDIDAVMIATPDHWHAQMALDAMRAGKDVALEKPIIRTIRQGQQLVAAARETGRVFRVDSEFRSGAAAHRATCLVRNGYIGKVRRVTVCVPGSDVPCPPQPDMPVPAELDYDRWLGPAPHVPYTVNGVHPPHSYDRPGWMRHLHYCDGMITNWGTHLNNGAMWATNTERTGPVEIEGQGTYPGPDSFWNVLLKFDVRYRFAEGLEWIYRTEEPYFIIEGDEGWVRADFQKLDAEPKSLLTVPFKDSDQSFRLKSEKQDFIDCVRDRSETLEPAEVGSRVTALGLLGHIAIRLGRKLQFDPVKEVFVNDDAANVYLAKPIENPRDP